MLHGNKLCRIRVGMRCLPAQKKRVALIMLIIALQFDVSTSCNEKTEINKMNKNCIVCVYTVSLSQLRNH